MDGAGEIYLGYRFKRLEVQPYGSADQGEILVELYWMESSDDAYGLLSGDWGGEILETINLYLQQRGVRISTGTIVDATIIHAPSSTKNQQQERDPQMHQTRKGKQWYYGMKAHVGVDSKSKLVHTVVATAANVADSTVLPELLHGEETHVWGDQAYRGQSEVIHECSPRAKDCTNKRYRYKNWIDEVERAKNRTKSRVRSKVEHVFAVLKLKFGFVKVRYRGITKNANRLFTAFALVNLFMVRKRLLRHMVAKRHHRR
jgi:IS5 family transposase